MYLQKTKKFSSRYVSEPYHPLFYALFWEIQNESDQESFQKAFWFCFHDWEKICINKVFTLKYKTHVTVLEC